MCLRHHELFCFQSHRRFRPASQKVTFVPGPLSVPCFNLPKFNCRMPGELPTNDASDHRRRLSISTIRSTLSLSTKHDPRGRCPRWLTLLPFFWFCTFFCASRKSLFQLWPIQFEDPTLNCFSTSPLGPPGTYT
jgi:hypothetical protein